jgi:pimeloyl-ACP methyl ester carboxylesterase
VRAPETRYVDNGGVSIAYQVLGDGPIDLAVVMGSWWHLDFQWTDPATERWLRRLAGFTRLILFDKRGTGLSDRVPDHALPTLEERMDDLRAVLDAVGSDRCAVFGESEGGPMAVLFAATYPERTSHLVLYGSYPRLLADDDYPAGFPREAVEAFVDAAVATWGRADAGVLRLFAPDLPADAAEAEWIAAMNRQAVSPGAMRTLMRMMMEIDVRPALPTVSAPTLVLHRVGDQVCPVAGGRYLAERIPGARYVELAGNYHPFALGDSEAILGEIEEFLTGVRPAVEPERVLATVLFTDIVGSTEHAARIGDRAWRELPTGTTRRSGASSNAIEAGR